MSAGGPSVKVEAGPSKPAVKVEEGSSKSLGKRKAQDDDLLDVDRILAMDDTLVNRPFEATSRTLTHTGEAEVMRVIKGRHGFHAW